MIDKNIEELERLLDELACYHTPVRKEENKYMFETLKNNGITFSDGWKIFEVDPVGNETTRIILHAKYPQPQGYCERLRKYCEKRNPGKKFKQLNCKIIDYPIDETISILWKFKLCTLDFEELERHNLEVKLIKPVKNGIIISYHFND